MGGGGRMGKGMVIVVDSDGKWETCLFDDMAAATEGTGTGLSYIYITFSMLFHGNRRGWNRGMGWDRKHLKLISSVSPPHCCVRAF